MKKMEIFEPAMCCPTGLCGVGVDKELLRISTVLNSLKKYGIEIERYNLTSAPQEFINNKGVNDYIMEKGVDDLPIILLNDEIIITGRYPTNEEFIKLLEIPETYLTSKQNRINVKINTSGRKRSLNAKITKSQGCGCSGGDCCNTSTD